MTSPDVVNESANLSEASANTPPAAPTSAPTSPPEDAATDDATVVDETILAEAALAGSLVTDEALVAEAAEAEAAEAEAAEAEAAEAEAAAAAAEQGPDAAETGTAGAESAQAGAPPAKASLAKATETGDATVEEADDGAPAGAEAALPDVPTVRERRSILVYLSYAWLGATILLAVIADLLPLTSYSVPIGRPRLSPSFESFDMLLGTDQQGRSVLSRCVYGARVSLLIGTAAGLMGALIGAVLGMVAGYLGRTVRSGITLVTDAMLAFPPLILLLALSSILTPSVRTLLIGLTLLIIPTFVRLSLANTLAWASREFVTAARNMGAGHGRILAREILPNLLPPLGAFLPIVMAALIVAEGSLSFLGAGIPPPQPSWGGMIADGKEAIETAPHMVFVPAGAIFFTVFALNQVGDHLRRRFDRTMRD